MLDGAVVPWGSPSVVCSFILTNDSMTQLHWAKWPERSLGTALLMRRAHRLALAHIQAPLHVWVHVADVGRPELPLPVHPFGLTISTVSRHRHSAEDLFPDYSFATWPAIGYDGDAMGWSEFQEALLLAGQRPARRRLQRRALFAGDATLHPARKIILDLARVSAEARRLIDVRDVPRREGSDSALFVPFEQMSGWEYLLDLPGGGWSGRLKFLPLLGRPLIVVERDAWGWGDGHVLRPGAHYRRVNATTTGAWQEASFSFNPEEVLAEVRWCKEHPAEAAAMAQRALEQVRSALTEQEVDAQAARVLGRAIRDAEAVGGAKDEL